MRGNGLLYGIQSIMNCWSRICVATDDVTLLGYSQLKLRAGTCLATVVPMGNMIMIISWSGICVATDDVTLLGYSQSN